VQGLEVACEAAASALAFLAKYDTRLATVFGLIRRIFALRLIETLEQRSRRND
jgi:hypothetical protein